MCVVCDIYYNTNQDQNKSQKRVWSNSQDSCCPNATELYPVNLQMRGLTWLKLAVKLDIVMTCIVSLPLLIWNLWMLVSLNYASFRSCHCAGVTSGFFYGDITETAPDIGKGVEQRGFFVLLTLTTNKK